MDNYCHTTWKTSA